MELGGIPPKTYFFVFRSLSGKKVKFAAALAVIQSAP